MSWKTLSVSYMIANLFHLTGLLFLITSSFSPSRFGYFEICLTDFNFQRMQNQNMHQQQQQPHRQFCWFRYCGHNTKQPLFHCWPVIWSHICIGKQCFPMQAHVRLLFWQLFHCLCLYLCLALVILGWTQFKWTELIWTEWNATKL